MTTDRTLTQIATLAPQVAREHAEHQEAIAAERDAEARVLERAIDLARPALRALSSRVLLGETRWTASDRPDESRAAEWRGVLLAGSRVPERDAPREDRGQYTGSGTYLRADGTLCEVTYSGTWSRWQGSSSEWTGTERALTPRQAMDELELADVLEALLRALQAQAGRERPTAAARARAERLEAVLRLIG